MYEQRLHLQFHRQSSTAWPNWSRIFPKYGLITLEWGFSVLRKQLQLLWLTRHWNLKQWISIPHTNHYCDAFFLSQHSDFWIWWTFQEVDAQLPNTAWVGLGAMYGRAWGWWCWFSNLGYWDKSVTVLPMCGLAVLQTPVWSWVTWFLALELQESVAICTLGWLCSHFQTEYLLHDSVNYYAFLIEVPMMLIWFTVQ